MGFRRVESQEACRKTAPTRDRFDDAGGISEIAVVAPDLLRRHASFAGHGRFIGAAVHGMAPIGTGSRVRPYRRAAATHGTRSAVEKAAEAEIGDTADEYQEQRDDACEYHQQSAADSLELAPFSCVVGSDSSRCQNGR